MNTTGDASTGIRRQIQIWTTHDARRNLATKKTWNLITFGHSCNLHNLNIKASGNNVHIYTTSAVLEQTHLTCNKLIVAVVISSGDYNKVYCYVCFVPESGSHN